MELEEEFDFEADENKLIDMKKERASLYEKASKNREGPLFKKYFFSFHNNLICLFCFQILCRIYNLIVTFNEKG